MTKEIWKKYFKLPLKGDDYNYAWDNDGNMALTFEFGISQEDIKKIIDSINGESNSKIDNLSFENVNFSVGKQPIFCIRSWGRLTGIGGHNLKLKKAAEIQDSFRDYVFNQLTK